jgi:hypothetical protein
VLVANFAADYMAVEYMVVEYMAADIRHIEIDLDTYKAPRFLCILSNI